MSWAITLEAQVPPTSKYLDSEAYGTLIFHNPREDVWVTPLHDYRIGLHLDWLIRFILAASHVLIDLLESP